MLQLKPIRLLTFAIACITLTGFALAGTVTVSSNGMTFDNLSDAVISAQATDTLTIDGAIATVSTINIGATCEINAKNLTVVGTGIGENTNVIDGANSKPSRGIVVRGGADVKFTGITFINASCTIGDDSPNDPAVSGCGSMFFVMDAATKVTLDSCFAHSNANIRRGAFMYIKDATVVSKNGKYHNNTQTGRGAVFAVGLPAAALTCDGDEAYGNTGTDRGVYIYAGGGTINVLNCNIYANSGGWAVASLYGGKTRWTLRDTKISGNYNGGFTAGGGADIQIDAQRVEISGNDNQNGWELWGGGNGGTCVIADSVFENQPNGGGMISNGWPSVTVTDSVFRNNSARGFAAWEPGYTATLTRCKFSGNLGGGVAVFNRSTLNLIDCDIEYNGSATLSEGAGVYVAGNPDAVTTLRMTGGKIAYNNVKPTGRGSGLFTRDANVDVIADGVLITGNVGDHGAGIYFSGGGVSSQVVKNSVIDLNYGIQAVNIGFGSEGTLENCVIKNTQNFGASGWGMAADAWGNGPVGGSALVTFKGCTFESNMAATAGWGADKTIKFENCTWKNYYLASDPKTLIELSAANNILTDCVIEDNVGFTNIYKSGSGTTTWNRVTVRNNAEGNYFDWWGSGSSGTISNSSFLNNNLGGGTIWGGSKSFVKTRWENNIVRDRLLWFDGGPTSLNAEVIDCAFKNNEGLTGLYNPLMINGGWRNLSITVKGNLFEGNTRDPGVGTGWEYLRCVNLFNLGNDNTVITDNAFKNNDGFAIYIEQHDDPNIPPAPRKVKFHNNTVQGNMYGGTVFAGNLNVEIVSNLMIKNTVPAGSGAELCAVTSWDLTDTDGNTQVSYQFKPNLTLTNNTIADNYGDGWRGGGGARFTNTTAYLANNLFWGNRHGGNWGHQFSADNNDIDGDYNMFEITDLSQYNYLDINGYNVNDINVENYFPGPNDVMPFNGPIDPKFVDSANNDYHIQSDSSAADKGDNSKITDPLWVDMDGDARIQGATVDIGADETAAAATVAVTGKVVLEDIIGQNPNYNYKATFKIYKSGNNDCSAPDAVVTANLDVNGNYSFQVAPQGAGCKVVVKAGSQTLQDSSVRYHFLAKKLTGVDLSGPAVLSTVNLPNGDANDDNIVDAFDFTILMQAYDIAEDVTLGETDLTNDGAVDAFDFTILMLTYDTAGDDCN